MWSNNSAKDQCRAVQPRALKLTCSSPPLLFQISDQDRPSKIADFFPPTFGKEISVICQQWLVKPSTGVTIVGTFSSTQAP